MIRTPTPLTGTPDLDADPGQRDPFEIVPHVLDLVRLNGAIFFRSEFRAPWAYTSPPTTELAGALPPGAGSLVMFHIVVDGHCWVEMANGVRREVSTGDVVVMPYGDAHVWGSFDNAEPVSIATLLPPTPWTELPHLQYGGDGPETRVVCGYLRVASALLRSTSAGVAEIATSVGYTSEEAFSRAFKRVFGKAPAHWRADRG